MFQSPEPGHRLKNIAGYVAFTTQSLGPRALTANRISAHYIFGLVKMIWPNHPEKWEIILLINTNTRTITKITFLNKKHVNFQKMVFEKDTTASLGICKHPPLCLKARAAWPRVPSPRQGLEDPCRDPPPPSGRAYLHDLHEPAWLCITFFRPVFRSLSWGQFSRHFTPQASKSDPKIEPETREMWCLSPLWKK